MKKKVHPPKKASPGLCKEHRLYGFTCFRRFDAAMYQMMGFPVFVMCNRLMVIDPVTMKPMVLPALWPAKLYYIEQIIRGL